MEHSMGKMLPVQFAAAMTGAGAVATPAPILGGLHHRYTRIYFLEAKA
jgi:hypothetical protein